MICGDLDSVRPGVLEYYWGKGVKIFKDTDQDSTDLMKCLKSVTESEMLETAVKQRVPDHPEPFDLEIDIVLLGGLGGRADQAFSQLHYLYITANPSPNIWAKDVYLITTESVIFVLEKGLNRIYAPVKPTVFTENVGIIPIGRPSVITTRGLEWDVTEWPTEFGGQMSTSNHIKAEVIEVESTERVLFTLEYDHNVQRSESRQH
jgi:thiamine pyrophosphokinase